MDNLLDEFIINWRKENNTEEAVYSSYHYDAMIAFAEHYHQDQVNNVVSDDVIKCGFKNHNESIVRLGTCGICGGNLYNNEVSFL